MPAQTNEQPAPEEDTRSKEVDSPVKTVLVVEDDTGIGTFLVQAISQETLYHALLAPDGTQALKIVESIKPSLFILDYHLPGINGIELYDKLHAIKELNDVPAIVVSARLPKHEIEKRHILSMTKPLELDDFLQAIENLLE
jgi:DNA-binding response OmpR family regulator